MKSEKAKTLEDSKGTKKGRLHLLSYKGLKGGDRYAVAAKTVKFANPADAKLGLFDRMFYILHQHTDEHGTTWYKINKNSLQKRLGVEAIDLPVDEKTGVATAAFDQMINIKQKALDQLLYKVTVPDLTRFEKQFLRALFESGINIPHTKILFFPADGDKSLFAYNNYADAENVLMNSAEDHSILIIAYNESDDDITLDMSDKEFYKENSINETERKFCTVIIDQSEYEKILSMKPIAQAILDKIS